MAAFKAMIDLPDRIKLIDIGGLSTDAPPLYQVMLESGAAELVGLESHPETLARLNAAGGARRTYLPAVLGDGQTQVQHVSVAPAMTSLLAPNPAVLNRFHGFPAWGQVVETRMVDTRRLDDLPQADGADLIKLDTQGSELMVLAHGDRRLAEAVVVHVKVHYLPLFRDQPLFGDIELFLRPRGFVLHRFLNPVNRVISPLVIDNNVYAGLNQVLWAEAVFIRDFTRTEAMSTRQLLALAAIAHDCYQSIDLTLFLLGVVDGRNGSALGPRYLERLRAG